MLFKLLFIFKAFHNEKRHAQQDGDDKVASQQLALPTSAASPPIRRNRADDQDGGVDGAHLDVELACGGEGIEMARR